VKIINFLCLFFISSHVIADWRQISEDDVKKYYVETQMIVPHLEGRRIAKELHELHKASKDGITSLRIRSEFNCKKNEIRILAMDRIAGEMGVGKIVSLQEKPSRWELISESDSRVKVLNYVCSY
jgi:hypothetical protein